MGATRTDDVWVARCLRDETLTRRDESRRNHRQRQLAVRALLCGRFGPGEFRFQLNAVVHLL